MRRRVRPRRFGAVRRDRPGRIGLLALAVGLMLGQGPATCALAQDRKGGLRDVSIDLGFGAPVGILELQPRLDIGRVFPGEILGAGSAQAISMGSWRSGATRSADFEFDTRIVRKMPAIWRMQLRDVEAMQTMNVRYELTSVDGRVGVLTSVDDPRSTIQVRVSPLSPVVLESTLDHVVIEGGLMLDLDLRDVRTAGEHTGTLTVTLENY